MKKRIFPQLKIRKLAIPATVAIATIVNVSLWTMDQKPQDGIILANEKVAIKYFDNKNGSYDILVETRNGTNISSEWDMFAAENQSFAYLVGREEKPAKEFFDRNLAKYGYEWTWEENYQIEGLDIPYTYPN